MHSQEHLPMERMEFFRRFVAIANWAWGAVSDWKPLAQDTMGKQLIRACDSIGANLVEGDGRYSDPDAVHFFVIARASARETRYWLERAADRNILVRETANRQIQELTAATRALNQLISYRRSRKSNDRVREPFVPYDIGGIEDDPFADDDFDYLTPNA